MPKPTSKRPPKPSPNPPASSKSTSPPAPYNTPPPPLRPFLESLNPTHIYITHLDTSPRTLKRRVFTVPILMNIAIVLLLLWRARVALPQYGALLLAAFGYESSARIDTANADWVSLGKTGGKRFVMFFIDWILASYILPWPLDFFLGSSTTAAASPISWRWAIGFQDTEIIVRKSRKWDRDLPKDWLAEEADGTIYQEKIMPGIDKTRLQTKTGYLTLDKNWDLDFAGMMSAHALVSDSRAAFADFRKTVIVYSEEHGWLVWPVWKLDEGSEEEGRRKIVIFKDRLTAMGKENLFFRWIELIQFETSQPGGFTAERQADAMIKARELFESQGVDFERFWKDVGGVQGLPGMEPAG